MTLADLTLRELNKLEGHVPELAGFTTRVLAETYDEFVEVLYDSIDHIIINMEQNPELRKDDGEDRLTIDIKDGLVYKGYNATHDTKHGGHTDLLVKRDKFIWIGEAKVHKDYDYLWEGFLQLATRYSTGDYNQKNGGLIIYVRVEDAKMVMDKWGDHLADKKLKGFTYHRCGKRPLSFHTSHIHEKSGFDFWIRHMPVLLYFNPADKSGRATAAKRVSKKVTKATMVTKASLKN